MTELWIYGLPKELLPALGLLKELGYRTVTVGREREAVGAISRAGMRAHVYVGAFSLNENALQRKGSLARRLDGSPAEWFGSGCPNNPKVRAASLNSVREAASIEGAEAIILDGIRFASPGEGIDVFMTCFCSACIRKAGELGYDMRAMRTSLRGALRSMKGLAPSRFNSIRGWHSPMDIFDLLLRFPGILDWLRFRADCICEHVADVREAIRSTNSRCKLGAYLFTPSLSYLVGQDYRRLARSLDYVEPMIYRRGDGVACLNFEVARMASDILGSGRDLDQAEVQGFLFDLLGLDAKPGEGIEQLREGISYGVIESETRRALRLVEAPKLIPVLFLDDPELRGSVMGALRAGALNLSFYRFYDGAGGALKIVDEVVRGPWEM
jgi:hypothetical protein